MNQYSIFILIICFALVYSKNYTALFFNRFFLESKTEILEGGGMVCCGKGVWYYILPFGIDNFTHSNLTCNLSLLQDLCKSISLNLSECRLDSPFGWNDKYVSWNIEEFVEKKRFIEVCIEGSGELKVFSEHRPQRNEL